MTKRARPWVAAVAIICVGLTGCGISSDGEPDEPRAADRERGSDRAPDETEPPRTQSHARSPDACLPAARATRGSLAGTLAWVRFCPGRTGYTTPAEIPSETLVSHLDLLTDLREVGGSADECGDSEGRTYRVQLGYADGRVAQVSGRTDPGCAGRLGGSEALVAGPEGLGVYGQVMKAFGQRYADGFEPVATPEPLRCPENPRDPSSVDRFGPSSDLVTGFVDGRRARMVMPVTAARGIACTWSDIGTSGESPAEEPEIRELTAEEAERVRIGMHAIAGGLVDCAPSGDPTTTVVVEDVTGTRRAVTIIGSECSTIIRSDGGYGLGFPWLEH